MMRQHLRGIPSRTGTRSTPRAVHRKRPARRRREALARAGFGTCALTVLALLAVLAGAVLATHGPSAAGPTPSPSPQAVAGPPHGPTLPAPDKSQGGPERPDAQQRDRARDTGRVGTASDGDSRAVRPRTVQLVPGDTLYGLAREHHTTVKALQRANGLGTSTLIYAGDTLRLAGGDGARSDASASRTGSGHGVTGPSALKRAASAPAADAAVRTGAAEAIGYARAQLGKPYVWGGTGPRGYDCSGLVMRAWAAARVDLPRTTWSQRHEGKAITRAGLVPGDLIISNNGGHVQLYIGDGKVIHAPGTGRTVTTAPLPGPSAVVSYRHITP
ncbi:C40 family peptidase [Streptomyces sp. NPDC057539]|uniref:C40 family peptidase n=1 Tax=Streptomyces sp. NPDC057539 TaxID=3346159 RepID=UPI0036865FD0